MDSRPNLFLVGMPRSGTTYLYKNFRKHSDIFVSWLKEPCYFGKDLTLSAPRLSENAYLQLYRKGAKHKYRIDSSVITLFSTCAAEEIHNFNPDAKIIIGLREPFSWAISFYSMLRAQREESRDFTQAFLSRSGTLSPKDLSYYWCMEQHSLLENILSLPSSIQRFTHHFPGDQIFFYTLDEMRKNPTILYLRICQWLAIKPLVKPPNATPINTTSSSGFFTLHPRLFSGAAHYWLTYRLVKYFPISARFLYMVYNLCRLMVLRCMELLTKKIPIGIDYTQKTKNQEAILSTINALETYTKMNLSVWKQLYPANGIPLLPLHKKNILVL